MIKTFLHAFAIGLDYGVELITFWRILAPMTVSTRCDQALVDRKERWTFLALLGRFLNWLSPGHTAAARIADINRAELAISELTPVQDTVPVPVAVPPTHP